jgi:hypothetical protein
MAQGDPGRSCIAGNRKNGFIVLPTLLKSYGKNAPLSVNFVYAWTNYPISTKLTLCGAPFPSIDGKLFCFFSSVVTKKLYKVQNTRSYLKKNSVTHGEVRLGGVRPNWPASCIVLTAPPLPHMVEDLI